MDAYVMIRDADRGSIESIKGFPQVKFAVPMTGPYLAIAVVIVDSLQELENLVLEDFQGAGVRGTETAISLMAPAKKVIKYRGPTPIEAFVRVWVEPGKARDVLDAASGLGDEVLGAAIVAADFDILLEVGGDTFDGVAEILLQKLHGLAGVARTATSFAVGVR
jgi:DNA-binding Lrp family transcriptional regulator